MAMGKLSIQSHSTINRVIVVTINVAERSVALAAGADAFVVKGDAPEQLRSALQAAQPVGGVILQ
jgi:hypothetical protein